MKSADRGQSLLRQLPLEAAALVAMPQSSDAEKRGLRPTMRSFRKGSFMAMR